MTHVNDARESGAGCALERAAYAMWRLNWIHPFCGGNGRTARAVAYLILCLDMGSMLPGVPTVPALIYRRRAEYIDALREADAGEKQTGTPDLAKLTNFLREVVTTQLASALTRLSFGGSAPAG